MAVFTQKMHGRYNAATHREFIMDGESESQDLAELPGLDLCARGSLAQHIKTGHWFILDSTGTWVPYPAMTASGSAGSGSCSCGSGSGSGSGGGGEVSDDLIATDRDVDEVLDDIWN